LKSRGDEPIANEKSEGQTAKVSENRAQFYYRAKSQSAGRGEQSGYQQITFPMYIFNPKQVLSLHFFF
jgi:hypothetical protein